MPFVEKKLDEFNRRRNFSPQRTLTRPPRLSESDGGQGAQRKDSPRRDTDSHREDFSWNHENTKVRKNIELAADTRRRTQTVKLQRTLMQYIYHRIRQTDI